MTGAARHHPRRQAFRRCNAYGASWLRPPCCGEQKLRRRIVEADLGPVRYLVALIGASDEPVLRYFILAEALLVRGGARCRHLRGAASEPLGPYRVTVTA